MRLGWRLLAFIFIAAALGIVLAAFTPGGLTAGALALLVGSTVAGWCMLALDGRQPAALGFHLSLPAVGELAKGTALGVAVGLVVVGVMAALGVVSWTGQEGSAVAWVRGAAGALGFLLIPAAAEEALLRGYPLQAVGEAWGALVAVVVTSVVFGLLHLANPGVGVLAIANIAVAGLLLGVIYVRTLSLWWATGAHLGWNWAHGYLVDVPVSGLEVIDAPLYEGVTSGPPWLGGGGFGPEGSLVSTVVVLGATAALWWGPWLKPGEEALKSEPLMMDDIHTKAVEA
ncbi:MAG: CPBP family intramembrane metalloprotease [Gemmatimonadetes bacterium]|nr:CPBP family intramembrane metalloprotease [Gemmatimonadota bacterium]